MYMYIHIYITTSKTLNIYFMIFMGSNLTDTHFHPKKPGPRLEPHSRRCHDPAGAVQTLALWLLLVSRCSCQNMA